jgi:hypothetical protein
VRSLLTTEAEGTSEACDLDNMKQADVIRAERLVQSTPGTASDQAAIYHHLEDPKLPLTPSTRRCFTSG